MPGDPATAAKRLRRAWMAVAGDPGVLQLADALEARTFVVDEHDRARYHATATIAASHVAGLMGQVERNAGVVGVPLAAYLDLAPRDARQRRGARTGSGAHGTDRRGDWETAGAATWPCCRPTTAPPTSRSPRRLHVWPAPSYPAVCEQLSTSSDDQSSTSSDGQRRQLVMASSNVLDPRVL